MASLYKDVRIELSNIVSDIKSGVIALPEIQRPFVWPGYKSRDLLDSMYRGYPIGTLMFWETDQTERAKKIGDGTGKRTTKYLIVDGQQRLTSLYAILTGENVLDKQFKSRPIKIAFNPAREEFEVSNAANQRSAEWIPNVTELWTEEYYEYRDSFFKRLKIARGGDLGNARGNIERAIERVRNLRNFEFQVVELMSHAKDEEVANIFVRINSKGTPLKQSDFVMTLMSVNAEESRVKLEAFCKSAVKPTSGKPSPANALIDPKPEQLLRVAVALAFNLGRMSAVYRLLLGKTVGDLETDSHDRQVQFEKLETTLDHVLNLTHWHEFLKCLNLAGFRNASMISSGNTVMLTYVAWLIGKLKHGLDYSKLRKIIARWFFMVSTTSRYTSSTESTLDADLRAFASEGTSAEAFEKLLESIIEDSFTQDFWSISFPNLLDSSSGKSPAMSAYAAALVLEDAPALLSNIRMRDLLDPGTQTVRSVERHHLFPVAFLKSQGVSDRSERNAIANMAYVDWPENMKAGAHAPEDYWPKMLDGFSEAELTRHMGYHALPLGWETMDYGLFKSKRRKLIASVVQIAFDKIAIDETQKNETLSLRDYIKRGENNRIEFKSSARFCYRSKKQEAYIEHAIIKTVTGFANAQGGILVIGVDDDGEVLGLENDYATLSKKQDQDGHELFLRQLFENHLSQTSAGFIHINYEKIEGKDLCRITVRPSPAPIFCKPKSGGNPTCFYVRMGNQTRELQGPDLMNYRETHWG